MLDSVAARYHLLTKYTVESVRGGSELDWSTQPQPVKEIVADHRVELQPHLPRRQRGTTPGAAFARKPRRGLPALSQLLFLTNGGTALVHLPGGTQLLRAAPSAGALYPTEVYVAVRDYADLEPGLYNYLVPRHELVRVWEGDQLDALRAACGDDARFEDAPLCVVLTGIPWRSAWRYQERGYRRVLLDTGHVLANLTAGAAHAGFTAHPLLGFMDAEINGLFFFDDSVEAVLACVPLTREEGPCVPGPLWTSPVAAGGELAAETIRSASDLATSATVRLHRAAACRDKSLAADADGVEPPVSNRSIPLAAGDAVYKAVPRSILRRRSARGYQDASVPLAALGGALGFAFGRHAKRRAAHFATRDAGLLRAHVVALAVDGLDAGLYAVEGAGEALLPLSVGSLREPFLHLSLGQAIAERCAAALVFSAAPAPALDLYGERAYRYLHLEAGAVGERFQLAATALGLAACGIGGFFDDEAARLVQGSLQDWVLYLVTIGRE